MALNPAVSDDILRPDQVEAIQQQLQRGRNDLGLQPYKLQEAQNTIESQKLKQAANKLDYSIQSLARVHDQGSYDNWRGEMHANGIDTAGDPDVYDPQWHQQTIQQAVAMKQKLSGGAVPDKIQVAEYFKGLDPTAQQAFRSANYANAARQGGGSALSRPANSNSPPLQPPAAPAQPNADDNLAGDDYLKTLDPQMASLVKMIGDGREKSSTVLSRMKPEQKQAILYHVNHYNPNYSANDFAGVREFNTGTAGRSVRSFNVAIEHLNTLEPLISALGNGDIKAVNAISNSISGQFGGVAINNFESAKEIVADEIAKAVIGGQNAERDREKLQSKVSAAKSTDQLMGVVATFKELMAGQLKGLDKQYQTSTGRNDFQDRLLLPKAKAEYGKRKDNTAPDADSADGMQQTPSGIKYRVIQ